MPVGPRLMPFTQHFVELRKRFTIIIVSILVLMFVFYTDTMYKSILGFILAPVLEYVPGGKLTVMGPFEALTFRFKVALFAAIVAASPIIIYNILAFMMPAFKRRSDVGCIQRPLLVLGCLLVERRSRTTSSWDQRFSG